jgi:hypothetical protein
MVRFARRALLGFSRTARASRAARRAISVSVFHVSPESGGHIVSYGKDAEITFYTVYF